MIIWTGWGIVVGLAGIICMVLTQRAVNAGMQDPHYYQTHGWPRLLGLWVAAAVSWPLGKYMNSGTTSYVVNPETGRAEPVRMGGGGHSLFFVPVQFWWAVFLILGIVAAITT